MLPAITASTEAILDVRRQEPALVLELIVCWLRYHWHEGLVKSRIATAMKLAWNGQKQIKSLEPNISRIKLNVPQATSNHRIMLNLIRANPTATVIVNTTIA